MSLSIDWSISFLCRTPEPSGDPLWNRPLPWKWTHMEETNVGCMKRSDSCRQQCVSPFSGEAWTSWLKVPHIVALAAATLWQILSSGKKKNQQLMELWALSSISTTRKKKTGSSRNGGIYVIWLNRYHLGREGAHKEGEVQVSDRSNQLFELYSRILFTILIKKEGLKSLFHCIKQETGVLVPDNWGLKTDGSAWMLMS